MSEAFASAFRAAPAAPVAARKGAVLRALGADRPGFRADTRFGADSAGFDSLPEGGEPAAETFTPEHFASEPGGPSADYLAGHAAGRAEALAEAAQADATRHRLTTALTRLDTAALDTLATRLTDTVLALCHTVIEDAAIDRHALAARVRRAVALLAQSEDARVIRFNPADLALIKPLLPPEWTCTPDPALEPGALRVEGVLGGVSDGPAQWRAVLAEAIGG